MVAITVCNLLAESTVAANAKIKAFVEELEVETECHIGMRVADHHLIVVADLAVTVGVGEDVGRPDVRRP